MFYRVDGGLIGLMGFVGFIGFIGCLGLRVSTRPHVLPSRSCSLASTYVQRHGSGRRAEGTWNLQRNPVHDLLMLLLLADKEKRERARERAREKEKEREREREREKEKERRREGWKER